MNVRIMVFVDSDLLINCMKGMTSKSKAVNATRKRARDVLEQVCNMHPVVRTTVFNLVELYSGAYRSKQVARNLHIIEDFLEHFEVVYPVMGSALENARLSSDLAMRGTPVGFSDLWIGSMVIYEGDILYTRNVGHFEKIPGLKIIDWSQPVD